MLERRENKKYAIGVFDSGFGGLNIMKKIVEKLPKYNYVYLGDNARAPYGSRSQDKVYEFTKDAVEFLFEKNCQLVILACNTASSHALKRIQKEYLPRYHPEKKVLGVIVPTLESIIEINSSKRVGVIATEGTVASDVFKSELEKINPSIKVFQRACPLLVPILEAGEEDSKIAQMAIEDCLNPLIKKKIDTLILGCTHYGLLEDKIKKVVGKKVRVVVEDNIVALKLKDYLSRHTDIEEELKKESNIEFFSTDLTEKFKKLGSKFYGKKITTQKVQFKN